MLDRPSKQQMNEENRITIHVKRIEAPSPPEDGGRILVDRRPERFATFAAKYESELAQHPIRYERAVRICELAVQKHVTLVYAAKDPAHKPCECSAGLACSFLCVLCKIVKRTCSFLEHVRPNF